ncbi:MAG: fibronectin type III domain-containing protein, partial [Saprospiraceae bacterium]
MTPNTSYISVVVANCGVGAQSDVSNLIGFTTVCEEPTGLSVSNVTATDADLNWTENGSATEWEIQYHTASFTPGDGSGSLISSITTNPYALSGLTTNTTYYFAVRAVCSEGNTNAWSTVESFTTICDIPTGLSSNNISENSVDLDWTQGSASLWEIQYHTSNFIPGGGIGTVQFVGSAPPYSLSGLIANTTYYFAVRANCSGNMSDWSTVESFTTACAAPNSLMTSNVTVTTADLGWTENGTATSWEIEYSTASFIPGSLGGTIVTTNPHTLSSLSASTTYYYAVRAVCSAGNTNAWSTVESFTTLCAVPSALSASNITSNSTDLDWTENGTATSWEVEYGASGFTQGSGTTITVNAKPYALSGLMPNTTYDFYVKT